MTKWKDINSSEMYPTHDFEKDKVLEGILSEKKEKIGQNESKLYTIEKAGGDKVSVWGSAVLDALYNLPIGSLVRIEYLGKEKGQRGTFYKNFRIQIDEETDPRQYIDIDKIPDSIEE